MNYYTADSHFLYENVISYENRPFSSVEEMDTVIINNINNTVSDADTLYILGDVGCADCDPTPLLKQIKAKKILIKGNHDARWIKHRHFRACFEDIAASMIVWDEDAEKKFFLSHYPVVEWDGYYKGIWHFYGHVHKSKAGPAALMDFIPTAVNVGMDVNEFMPKTAMEYISKRMEYVPPSLKRMEQVRHELTNPAPMEGRGKTLLSLDGFSFKKH